jgi:flagellar M-ring protein FliF
VDLLKRSFSQIGALAKGLSPRGKATAAAIALVTLGSGGALVAYAGSVDYAPLFTNLGESDAARVIDKLRAAQVPYRLSSDGRSISVPWEKVPELRVEVASEGAVKGTGGAGLELFERGAFGQSELAEHVTLTRALQGELSRTIGGLEPVERALVHLGRPMPSMFVGAEKPATASVVLRLKPGRTLSARQVAGIKELVASSVEGLETSRVSVLDASGVALSSGASSEGDEGGAGLQREGAVEERLVRKAQSLLDQAFGPGKALVRVTARVTREKIEERRERFEPQGVARSESTTTRTTTSKGGARGSSVTVGVSGNLPGARSAGPEGDESKDSEETQTTQYEVGKTTQVVTKEAGAVERLSIGLLLDESIEKSSERVEKIVKEAVGFDAKRGDTFERGLIPMKSGELDEAKKSFDDADAREKTRELVRDGVLGAAVLLAAIVGLLGARKGSQPRPTPRDAAVAAADAGPSDAERRRLLRADAAREANASPELAGRLIEQWLTEGKTGGKKS